MLLHANAKLGLAGRLALVRVVEDGLSLKAAAAAFNVSPATATQLNRRPAPDQPRSQRPWVGQLIWDEVCQVAWLEGPRLRAVSFGGESAVAVVDALCRG